MSWALTKFLIPCYMCPGNLFYMLLVFVLFKHRKSHFKSPFFKICFLVGLIDCTRNVIYIVTYVFPRLSWFLSFYRSNQVFCTFGMVTYNSLMRIAAVFYIVLAANRMTALALPFRHNAIWNKRATQSTVGAVFVGLLGVWNYIPIFRRGCYYALALPNVSDALAPLSYRATIDDYAIWSRWNPFFYGAIALGLIVLYAVAFSKAYVHSKSAVSQDRTGQEIVYLN